MVGNFIYNFTIKNFNRPSDLIQKHFTNLIMIRLSHYFIKFVIF